MKAPTLGLVSFLHGVRKEGFLAYVGRAWRRYGDCFQLRIGPRTLFFAMHPEAVERVNVANRQGYDKLRSYDGVRKYILGQGLVVSTGELWRRQRKLMAPFYTPKAVQEYADVMIADGERMAARWDELARQGVEVDMAEEMTRVTQAIILKSMFSTESMHSIDRMKEAVDTMLDFVASRMSSPLPDWVPTPKKRRHEAAQAFVRGAIRALVAERRAMAESEWPDDLLSRLMKARDEETGLPMAESLLHDESLTIFAAGHETTARTMTFAWYALAANPHVAARLHEELDGVLGGRTPTLDDLKQLPYTLRVVKEVLRLYPPAPFYARDAVQADTIGGYDVPAGASVMLSPYYTHRHPDFWEDPEVFDPDRWTREREARRHPFAYHPFATGPRICLGNNFSLLESHILLAVLAQRFEPRLRPGFVPRWEMRGTLAIAGGLPMVIVPRSSAQRSAAAC